MPPLPPHSKNVTWIILSVVIIALLIFYLQKPPKKGYAEQTFKGLVVAYQTNRIGDVDKLIMTTADQKLTIHFPPHTAFAVMKAAPKNKIADLEVHAPPAGSPVSHEMSELKSVRSSSPVLELRTIPPQAPASGKKIEISGKAGNYKLDEKGMVTGIIIQKYLIDLPRGLVKNILPVLKDSSEVRIKGYERSVNEGFVNLNGLIVVKPYAISIDKTDYLL